MFGKFGDYRPKSQFNKNKLIDEDIYRKLLKEKGFQTNRSVVPFPLNELTRYFGNLYELLLDSPPDHLLAEHHCRYWFKQIALAVEYLHSKGINHSNIVPRTILYVYRDRHSNQNWDKTPFDMIFKLGDFHMTSTGKRSIDFRKVDIYQLGMTLGRALIGRHKFIQNLRSLQSGRCQELKAVSSNLNISKEAAHLISSMTSSDPMFRPSIQEVLKSQWILSNQTNPKPVRQSTVKIHVMLPIGTSDRIPYFVWPVIILFSLGSMYFVKLID